MRSMTGVIVCGEHDVTMSRDLKTLKAQPQSSPTCQNPLVYQYEFRACEKRATSNPNTSNLSAGQVHPTARSFGSCSLIGNSASFRTESTLSDHFRNLAPQVRSNHKLRNPTWVPDEF